MTWLGELIKKEIDSNDTILSLGCGIFWDIEGIVNNDNMYGIDIYEPYVKHLNEKGYNVKQGDITKINFDNNSYDIVLMLDVLEHLEYLDAINMIEKAKKTAIKKVIVYTPSTFFDNEHTDFRGNKIKENNIEKLDKKGPYQGLGYNKYQKHISYIEKSKLEKLGFKCIKTQIDNNIYGVWTKNET